MAKKQAYDFGVFKMSKDAPTEVYVEGLGKINIVKYSKNKLSIWLMLQDLMPKSVVLVPRTMAKCPIQPVGVVRYCDEFSKDKAAHDPHDEDVTVIDYPVSPTG